MATRYLYNALLEPDIGCPTHKYGVPINSVSRQVSLEDFNRFTHILAADESNLANLKRIQPKDSKAKVRLFGSYDDNKAIGVSDLPVCLSGGRGLILVRWTVGPILRWNSESSRQSEPAYV